MLGTDLMEAFSHHALLGLDLPDLDITDARQCRKQVSGFRPDVILLAAAMTDVDDCQLHAEEAERVNGQGTGNMAEAARSAGALLVHYSTDYVFEGTQKAGYEEDDPPNPISAYGRSKLHGEERVRETCPEHLILRTSWLFGCHGKNFIRTIVTTAGQGRPLQVVDDQVGSPTYARDLAERTVLLLESCCRGTYHVTNSGSCSWYELALRSLAWAGMGGTKVKPVKTLEYPRPAPRPPCSILRHARMQREGFPPMRPWQEAVRDYIGRCLTGR